MDEFVAKLQEEFKKLVEGVASEAGVDLAYYEVKLTVTVLDSTLTQKIYEHVLYDSADHTYCTFCHRETRHYVYELGAHVCPACLGKFMGAKLGSSA